MTGAGSKIMTPGTRRSAAWNRGGLPSVEPVPASSRATGPSRVAGAADCDRFPATARGRGEGATDRADVKRGDGRGESDGEEGPEGGDERSADEGPKEGDG